MLGFFALTLLDPECGCVLVVEFVGLTLKGVVTSGDGDSVNTAGFVNSTLVDFPGDFDVRILSMTAALLPFSSSCKFCLLSCNLWV